MSKQEWYADGLSFECTQCGNCCTGPPGFVWATKDELRAMAEHVGMTPKQFRQTYARKVHGEWSLNETLSEHGYDCVFLRRDERGKAQCSIYEVRPTQCRTWPFWPENLRSSRAWIDAAQRCPGMMTGLQGGGTFVPIEEIRIRRDATT